MRSAPDGGIPLGVNLYRKFTVLIIHLFFRTFYDGPPQLVSMYNILLP